MCKCPDGYCEKHDVESLLHHDRMLLERAVVADNEEYETIVSSLWGEVYSYMHTHIKETIEYGCTVGRQLTRVTDRRKDS